MKKLLFLPILALVSLVSCENKNANALVYNSTENPAVTLELETIIESKRPWSMTFLSDDTMLVTEIDGKLLLVKNGTKTEIDGLPEIEVRGQGGLLDIEAHPNYSENGWIYFTYATSEGDSNDGANTAVMRAKIENNTLVKKEQLYRGTPNEKSGNHFGSRLAFDKNNFLYFSIGDRFNRDVNPQDITKDGGKIYRLNDDGSIPESNPFHNEPNAKKAIFTFGNRNPQGMALNPETGEIWTHEHGPKGGDEINIMQAGKNYGWPKASYGINYNGTTLTEHTSLPGMEDPIHYWVPSIAPSGMEFVTSERYPSLKGNLLVGSLKFQYLNHCHLENNKVVKEEKLFENIGRVRSVKQSPDGFIYLAVEGKGILKIK
ncbi:PQQ-dependent sugar dehydrogenase [Urechidicola vernalis]|uniref:PQQ-dependent sugar dehydrogenase n=1 Tax=Urechidicola vernalis TaxID=3075600 RepID=A0ABU2Y2V8_9FLAO|nr:PQQ-dependent sugar dehydrogenase [Urechidicola sp. P050]MDT0552544.1 PQQ-dependent sugar dehydrogenase [Urechidicola sp. P050]